MRSCRANATRNQYKPVSELDEKNEVHEADEEDEDKDGLLKVAHSRAQLNKFINGKLTNVQENGRRQLYFFHLFYRLVGQTDLRK